MSVSAILSNDLFVQFQQQQSSTVQNNQQQFQQEFAQLGQDLEAGNLSAAQSDFATLEQLTPQSQNSTSTSTSTNATNNPIAQAFSQLGQDLAAGNTAAAQQDFTNLQQDLQNAQQSSFHPHHHHGGGGGGESQISQLFQQLGQDLQSGNLSEAQQAYNSIVQNFQQELTGGASTSTALTNATSTNTATTNSVSLSA